MINLLVDYLDNAVYKVDKGGMNLLNNEYDYEKLMSHLIDLPACALITTGRTGSDFLQSLLDSHTEVLTFNGIFFFHEFWEQSRCVNYAITNNLITNVSDLLEEFAGVFLHKFKSQYDYKERKDCLGINGDQHIDIDLNKFKMVVTNLLNKEDITSRNFMLAAYGSYAICLNQNLDKKKILFHHIHHAEKLHNYIIDFPNSRILCMTRDPRANFVSGIVHHRKQNVKTDNELHLLYYIKRIIIDAYSADDFSNNVMVLRIEDLGEKKILINLCNWLKIQYEDSMTESTWGGMFWRGDRVSRQENTGHGFSAKMLDNQWEKKLSRKDKYIFNFLMNDRLKNYKYSYKKVNLYDYLVVPFILFLPLKFELRFFSMKYIKNASLRELVVNCIWYISRVLFFYKTYYRTLSGFKFSRRYIKYSE